MTMTRTEFNKARREAAAHPTPEGGAFFLLLLLVDLVAALVFDTRERAR